MALPAAAIAQRTAENAVVQAEDAFGTSIGRENIGLYSSASVRGFSPTAAGNVRIEGLAFDQVWGLTGRIRQSTTIKVGISTLGTPFPAPTGIVDYALRKPADEAGLSILAGADSYAQAYVEADLSLPIANGLTLGLGGASYANSYVTGAQGFYLQGAAILRWSPSPEIEIIPYWNRSEGFDDQAAPIFVPAGPFLPPPIQRRRFLGPDWGGYFGAASNTGVLGWWRPRPDLEVKAGLFRSKFDDQQSFAHLLVDLQQDGSARRIVIADPPIKLASTSGELRLTRSFIEGQRLHRLHASVRARNVSRRTNGSDLVDFGLTSIEAPFTDMAPDFAFSEQTRDSVRQWTAGLAYEGRWKDFGELGLGVQKTNYSKRILLPELGAVESRAQPWLFSANAAVLLARGLALYGGYARGLEESGVAPGNASNRNEALPAILTTQRDFGIRYSASKDLRLIAGLFDVRKPYFNLDENNRFDLLGDVKHQGLEVSLAGNLTPNLNVVAGAVLLRARVTGEGVTLGRVGPKPVGQTDRTLQLNLDWQMPAVEGLSLDLGISHKGDIVATRDNLVSIPSRTLVNLGARYRATLGSKPVTLRLTVTNLTDQEGFDLRGAGAYAIIPGRVIGGWIAVDL